MCCGLTRYRLLRYGVIATAPRLKSSAKSSGSLCGWISLGFCPQILESTEPSNCRCAASDANSRTPAATELARGNSCGGSWHLTARGCISRARMDSGPNPAPIRYRPGDVIPRLAVYRVIHAPHRADHFAILRGGDHFPRCHRCGDVVQFEMTPIDAVVEPSSAFHSTRVFEVPHPDSDTNKECTVNATSSLSDASSGAPSCTGQTDTNAESKSSAAPTAAAPVRTRASDPLIYERTMQKLERDLERQLSPKERRLLQLALAAIHGDPASGLAEDE